MFVKDVSPTKVSHVSNKTFNSLPSEGKMKMFVPICHYYNMSGDIHLDVLNI